MNLSLLNIEASLRNALDSSDQEDQKELVIHALNVALKDKVDSVVGYRESQLTEISKWENLLEEVKNKINQLDKKAKKLDEYILNCMEINGKESFDGSIYTIKKRKPSKRVTIVDETLIPIEFIKIPEVKPMIMKKEIGDKLKAGELIDGAILEDGEKSISIRLK